MHFFGSFLLLTAYYYHVYANKLKEAEPLKHTVFILQLPSYHKQCIYSPLSTNASILSLNGCKCSSGDSQQTPCTFFSHPATTTERDGVQKKGKDICLLDFTLKLWMPTVNGQLSSRFSAIFYNLQYSYNYSFFVCHLYSIFFSKHALREKQPSVFLPP